MFLPVRSSLYACYPSAGACLIAADVVTRCWNAAAVPGRQRAVIAAIVATLGMTPVYVVRNRSTLANARFSSRVLRDLASRTHAVPPGGVVIVFDDRTRRPNVETAFNMALDDAFELTSGRRLEFWVEPELQHAKLAGRTRPCPACAAMRIDLRHQ
jgi:hypothetical protein